MRLDVAGRSDTGKVRDRNEDRFAVLQETGDGTAVCILADGMGGHAAGDVAATVAVEATIAAWRQGQALDAAVADANAAVFRQATTDASLRSMGTTLVATLISPQEQTATIAHVGDSRAYLVRAGQARQLTTDHSWVMDEVRAGHLTAEEAQRSTRRNMLTRALGAEPSVAVETSRCPLEEGDAVVLCSDGVHGYVDDRELADACAYPAARGADYLVDLVLERGAPDNATVVIARLVKDAVSGAPEEEVVVAASPPATPPAPPTPSRPRAPLTLGIVAALAVAAVLVALAIAVHL